MSLIIIVNDEARHLPYLQQGEASSFSAWAGAHGGCDGREESYKANHTRLLLSYVSSYQENNSNQQQHKSSYERLHFNQIQSVLQINTCAGKKHLMLLNMMWAVP